MNGPLPAEEIPFASYGRPREEPPVTRRERPPTGPSASPAGLDPRFLDDATVVAAEGMQIAKDGVPYLVVY
jgi:hypothetical protein